MIFRVLAFLWAFCLRFAGSLKAFAAPVVRHSMPVFNRVLNLIWQPRRVVRVRSVRRFLPPIRAPGLALLLLLAGLLPASATTTNFAYNNAAVVYSGYFVNNGSYEQLAGYGTQVEFNFTGTQLVIGVNASVASPIWVWIDGVQQTVPAISPLNASTTITLATGLTDAAHTCKIKQNGATGLFYFANATAFQVTGSAPALSAPSTNTGTQIGLANTALGTWNGQMEGFPALTTSDAGYSTKCYRSLTAHGATYTYPDIRIRVRRKCSNIKVWTLFNNTYYTVYRDGVQIAHVQAAPPTGFADPTQWWDWLDLGLSLDNTTEHEYIIHVGDASRVGSKFADYLYALQFVGDGGAGAAVSARTNIAAYIGDSTTLGIGVDPDTVLGWPQLDYVYACFTQGQSWDIVNRGYGGDLIANMTARVTDLPAAAKVVRVVAGTNDAGANRTNLQFTNDFTAFLTAITGQCSGAVVLVSHIIPRTDTTQAANNVTAFNAIIDSVVSGFGNANVRLSDITGNFVSATDLISDKLHPDALGCIHLSAISGPYTISANLSAPLTPGGLGSLVASVPVTLSWNTTANAAFYSLYRDGVLLAANLTGTSYTDTIAVGSSHTYQIMATNGGGSSALSSAITVIGTAGGSVVRRFIH